MVVFLKAWLHVALIYRCPALKHTGICGRGDMPLWHRHQPDGSMPLTERKGMQHLLVTGEAWVVLHIGSCFKCVSSHRLAFCFSAILDAAVGKLNSPKMNFLSYYKLTLGGCYSDCRAASELCKHSLPLPITLCLSPSRGMCAATWIMQAVVKCKPNNFCASSRFPCGKANTAGW